MKELNLRFSIVLLMVGMGVVAGVTELVRLTTPETVTLSAEQHADGGAAADRGAQSGAANGGDSETVKVRWTSLIPGSFK